MNTHYAVIVFSGDPACEHPDEEIRLGRLLHESERELARVRALLDQRERDADV